MEFRGGLTGVLESVNIRKSCVLSKSFLTPGSGNQVLNLLFPLIMQTVQRTTKTFLENWLQKTVKQYVSAMNGHENGHLHDLIVSGVEKPLVEMVLKETCGNQTQAANILGINRNTLRKKIKEYDLK